METRRWLVRLAVAASMLGATIPLAPAQQPIAEAHKVLEIPLGLDAYMPVPEADPMTAEKVALGQRLFYDPILSRDGKLSCASCHELQNAFTDAKPVSVGVFGRRGTRRVPALINRGYGSAFFWDGRAASLEEQVLQPIQNPNELGMSTQGVLQRLTNDREYRRQFQAAFQSDPTAENLAQALASFVRSILSGDSPLDRFLNGDTGALSPAARRGFDIFRGKGNCTACHMGPNFTDEQFHNTGVAWHDGKLLDIGRFAVTGKDGDQGAFKTPTLREVARTSPYMHDGSLATLAKVIDFYNRGGNPNPHLDPELHPLRLTPQEKQALLAFLRALNGTVQDGIIQ